MARFCPSLHDRRRSRPVIICMLAISMSLALLQAPQLALVRTSRPNRRSSARRPFPEAYAFPTGGGAFPTGGGAFPTGGGAFPTDGGAFRADRLRADRQRRSSRRSLA